MQCGQESGCSVALTGDERGVKMRMHELLRCENCLAFEAHPEGRDGKPANSGDCRRGAPTALSVPTRVVMGGHTDAQIASAWPPVPRDAYCLAIAPKPEVVEILKGGQCAAIVVAAASPMN